MLDKSQIGVYFSAKPEKQIEDEFVKVKNLQKQQKEISLEAKAPHNRDKNRYPDVLPNEETRVKLNKEEENDSDYINSNHVRGEEGLKSQHYICCQAPLPNTMADFWRMIWEKNCPVIVMLTRIVERNSIKADMYWPEFAETSQQYGKIVVHCVRVKQPTDSIICREFEIINTRAEHEGSKKVVQLHYTEWPDQGVPETTKGMAELIREVDIRKQGLNDPIVVHCSAGVGRTGTFLAIHLALQKLTYRSVIDVMKTVLNLRQQRSGMVQSKDQYKFVYATINDVYMDKYQPLAKGKLKTNIRLSNSNSTVETRRSAFRREETNNSSDSPRLPSLSGTRKLLVSTPDLRKDPERRPQIIVESENDNESICHQDGN